MDGYHYYKSRLREMPDVELAFARRGAPWTFDSEKFVSDLEHAKEKGEGLFPSFDHSIGDPSENAIHVTSSHDFVIVEGLYLLLDKDPWVRLKDMLDMTIFIDSDMSILRERLINRHMVSFGMSREEAAQRADTNDIPNALEVIAMKHRADIILQN